jgi:hypothetical protein
MWLSFCCRSGLLEWGGERSGLSGSWPLRREVAGGHVAERTVWADLNNDSFMDLYVGDY